jgi:anti-anti-sigma regulatory factor
VPVTVFHIKGRINLESADDLRQSAQDAHNKGARDLLLDMNDVLSLTSEGLRAVHYIYKLFLGEKGGEETPGSLVKSEHFKLVNPPEGIRRVLNIAGFDTFIEVLEDLEEAVKSF